MSYSGIESSSGGGYTDSNDRGTSVVDQHSEVEGTYNTSRDLRIEGRLSGMVNCDGVLFIADGAEVDASVEAASIIVSGNLKGQIRCRGRLEITATGSVGGEVETASLVIVEGARYEGQITMSTGSQEMADTNSAADEPAAPPTDSYSLLRRYASGSPEVTDDAPAADVEDEDDQN
jgi:cytoskeletal protein CcmA (bactofilin family)